MMIVTLGFKGKIDKGKGRLDGKGTIDKGKGRFCLILYFEFCHLFSTPITLSSFRL